MGTKTRAMEHSLQLSKSNLLLFSLLLMALGPRVCCHYSA